MCVRECVCACDLDDVNYNICGIIADQHSTNTLAHVRAQKHCTEQNNKWV